MVQKFVVTIDNAGEMVLDSDVQYTLNTYLRRECPASCIESVEVEETEEE